ncbi:MAG: GTP cyclohydrolase I FolE [Waddliaceae bacterium]
MSNHIIEDVIQAVMEGSTPYPFLDNGLSDQRKIEIIEHHFSKILETLGMDLTDDSLMMTPRRYAKMFVLELFQGLKESSFPKITTQENKFQYNNPLIESNISVQSVCEHHFIPIIGYCHIAYIPKDRVIGLSKLNRLTHHFARRPQVQERMTKQISETLSEILETPDVAVVIDAMHFCVRMRGIQDQEALTRTMDLNGAFLEDPIRREFFETIPKISEVKI